jgi:S-adenosylmethionine-diacylgycerolhomoserine-N-methlytransferase
MADAATEMDAIYRVQRHIYDASRKYYLLGRDGLINGLDAPPGGSVLEVGCGTGRNLILAAEHYPAARFYGFDVSNAMLETARKSIERWELSHSITLAQADASRFDAQEAFGIDGFDRVFISYALSMIPPWQDAIVCAYRAVKPGGSLHIVDFGEQRNLPSAFRTGLRAWLRKFAVYPRADLEPELRRLAAETGAELTFERPFRDYACNALLKKPVEVGEAVNRQKAGL